MTICETISSVCGQVMIIDFSLNLKAYTEQRIKLYNNNKKKTFEKYYRIHFIF